MEYIGIAIISFCYLGNIYFLNKRIDIVNKRCDEIQLVFITFIEGLKNSMEKKDV